MDSAKQSNKISDIVELKRMLKKWRLQASNGSSSSSSSSTSGKNSEKESLSRSNSKKKISFLKRTLSFTDLSTNGGVSTNAVPKGFLAVHVGEDMKRFVIPTNFLEHPAFCLLLKEAENEFGFQQEGVLRIPCQVEVFENILRRAEAKNSSYGKKALKFSRDDGIICGSTERESLSKSHLPPSPMCR